MEDAIDRLMAGSYQVEDRMMLCGQIYRQGRDGRGKQRTE